MQLTRILLLASASVLALTSPLAAQQPETAVPAAGAPTVRGTGPNGATMRCRDGFYPAPGAADAACAERGGVLVRFPTINNAERRQQSVEQGGAVAERRGEPAPELRDTTKPPPGVVPFAEQQAKAREEAARPAVPANARLLCMDGTFIVADTSATRCTQHGGVRVRLGDQTRVQVRPIGSP